MKKFLFIVTLLLVFVAQSYTAHAESVSTFGDPRLDRAFNIMPAQWQSYVIDNLRNTEVTITGDWQTDPHHPDRVSPGAGGYMEPSFKNGQRFGHIFLSPESARTPIGLAVIWAHELTHARQWQDGYLGTHNSYDVEQMAYDIEIQCGKDIDAAANKEVIRSGGLLQSEGYYDAMFAWFHWYYGRVLGISVGYSDEGLYVVYNGVVITQFMPGYWTKKQGEFIPALER